jgi:hypothetical protein
MNKWLRIWIVFGAVALAGAGVLVYWFPAESATTCEFPLRKGLTDDQAWDALAGVVARHFTVERSEKVSADGTGVLFTGWVTRMHERDLGGKRVRVMVVLHREARKVSVMCEAERLRGETWKPTSDDGLLRQLTSEIRLAVGDRPAVPT